MELLLFIWASLVALFLIALPSVIQTGPELIGKSFVDTREFKARLNPFMKI